MILGVVDFFRFSLVLDESLIFFSGAELKALYEKSITRRSMLFQVKNELFSDLCQTKGKKQKRKRKPREVSEIIRELSSLPWPLLRNNPVF